MDLGLSREQRMLQRAARELLTSGEDDLWPQLVELGWVGLLIPEEHDGQEMSWLDLAIVLEQAGRVNLPGPYLSTVLAGLTLMDVGTPMQRSEWLPRLAAGESVLTTAVLEEGGSYAPEAIAVRWDGSVHGTKLFVPDAAACDAMLVVARADEPCLVLVQRNAVSTTPMPTFAGEALYRVDLDGAPAELVAEGWAPVERLVQRGALAQCCLMVGGAERMLELALEHAKSRRQFGRPIGSFQAVQHHCADMAIDVDSARMLTFQAAWSVAEGLPSRREVSMAKAWTSEAYRRVSLLAHRILGATGFTMEHDLQTFSRRGKAAELAYGGADLHYEVVAAELGL